MLGFGIDQAEKLLNALQAPDLAVNPRLCLRLRHRLSNCTLCSDYCPTGAIEWDEGTLKVDPEKCISCGICSSVCPSGVFEALRPNDAELLKAVQDNISAGKKTIVFECDPDNTQRATDAILVRCLGRLNEGVLAGCIALGADSVNLSPGKCAGCKIKNGLEVTKIVAGNTNHLLSAFGLDKKITFKKVDKDSPEQQIPSRREFFSSMASSLKKSSGMIATNVLDSMKEEEIIAKGNLPYKMSAKRRFLLASLLKLGEIKKDTVTSPLFCNVHVRDGCTGCQMCAFFCPTGAIGKIDEDGAFGLSFRLSDCVACGLCRDICYKKVIDITNQVETKKIVERPREILVMVEDHNRKLPWEQEEERVNIAKDMFAKILFNKPEDSQ